MNGADKSLQKIQGAPEAIDEQTEEPGDFEAEEIARRKAEVENVRRKVERAMRTAGQGTMRQWRTEVEKRVYEKAIAAELGAKAENAKCRAEAAEREAEVARVVVLEAVSELEKAAASEIARHRHTERQGIQGIGPIIGKGRGLKCSESSSTCTAVGVSHRHRN